VLGTLRGTAYFRGQGQGTGFLMVVFRLFIFRCLISKTKKQQQQQQLKQQTVDQKHNKAKKKQKKLGLMHLQSLVLSTPSRSAVPTAI